MKEFDDEMTTEDRNERVRAARTRFEADEAASRFRAARSFDATAEEGSRLVRAFVGIRDPVARDAVLQMVERLARG